MYFRSFEKIWKDHFEKFIDKILDTAARQFQLRRKIDSRIEPAIFEESHDPSGFLEEIMRTASVIYFSNE